MGSSGCNVVSQSHDLSKTALFISAVGCSGLDKRCFFSLNVSFYISHKLVFMALHYVLSRFLHYIHCADTL